MLRVTLAAVGRLKAGPERELADRYLARAKAAGRPLGLAVDAREIDESKARRPEDRKGEEAKAILAGLPPETRIVALDERGTPLDSPGFARLLGEARDAGLPALALLIGGPDGLDGSLRERAAAVLAFGTMTWPHQLVRVMASEQIYRAVTILAGHPYHRA